VTRPDQVIGEIFGWPRVREAAAALRAHWIAAALLTAGLVLRIVALAAYHPALLYTDTLKYLYGAWSGADPLGYAVILKIIGLLGGLGTMAAIQHLLGLAMAVAIYALMIRRGLPRWLAAVAIAPVLLDAYQLQIEQMIMPDVWFEAFVVAGLVLLLWHPQPPAWAFGAAGLIFGTSATVRQIGEVLVLPALLYVAAATTTRRHAMRSACALLAAFALPILVYSTISYTQTGRFQLSDEGSIAGRLAASVDCTTIYLTSAERPYCPTPAQQARGADWLEHSSQSPLKRAPVPAGMTRGQLISAFDSAVEQQQSVRIVASILRDSLRIFATTKSALPGVTPISRWQFQTSYPTFPPEITLGRDRQIRLGVQVSTAQPFVYTTLAPAYGGRAQVDRPLAAFLRAYQLHGGYTPGPLLALFALASLAGSVIAFAGRRFTGRGGDQDREHEVNGLALACLLIATSVAGVLLISDIFEFSWRYQLPALVMLPPAGVLGSWAVWRALAKRSVTMTPAAVATVTTAIEPTPV
jgi:hypothetical protein